jgi:hypothetical protein
MAESAPAKAKIPSKPPPQQKKKKKKNAPDKPRPAWLFPPDEENPVLNPRQKTSEDTAKQTQERDKALSYMRRRVHSVPDRPAPPPQLLTLVGIFLSDFGFNSTSRLFTTERKARKELNGWEDAIGKKIEKGHPTLETIYRDWYREWKIKQNEETSSSESSSETSSESDSGAELPTKQATTSSGDDDSETSSDGRGGSDAQMKEAPKVKRGKAKNKKIPASSLTTTSSESDADDEDEKVKPLSAVSKKAESMAKQGATKPTGGAMINRLKRKAASRSSDSSESSLSSDEEELHQAKKPKTTSKATATPAVLPGSLKECETKPNEEESSSSSSDSSSASDSEGSSPPKNPTLKVSEGHVPKLAVKPVPVSPSSESSSASASDSDSDHGALAHAASATSAVLTKTRAQPAALVSVPSSDSSATINGDSKKPSASISAASEASSATSSESPNSHSESPLKSPPKKPVAENTKRKHEGAKPTPLATLSATTAADSYISNKYQNYDYAERAYKDLSVTRGKGFTKEKNKKKRGSYRGGAIDTSGGKGFKFED